MYLLFSLTISAPNKSSWGASILSAIGKIHTLQLYACYSDVKLQNAMLAILFKVRPSQPEKTPKIAFLNFVNKKLRFGSGIIGWVFVCVFCKQNAKMTKFVRKIVIFEFCKQNTLTVTLCMMPEPYVIFLQTESKNVILANFFVNILLGAPELWCPSTRSLVPFQADQGKGHQSSGAQAPEVWCPSKLTNRFFVLISFEWASEYSIADQGTLSRPKHYDIAVLPATSISDAFIHSNIE